MRFTEPPWGLVVRGWTWIYQQHFRVSRPMYVLIALVGAAAWVMGAPWIVGVVAIGVSGQGLARWYLQSHPRPVLAVCLFASADPERAREVQRTIMTTLSDRLGATFPLPIISIPQFVGGHEATFASILRRRSRAMYLLFGDIRVAPTGDVAVYPRLVQPSRGDVTHVDESTHEVIPQRTVWEEVLLRLSGGVIDYQVEYPFEFADELVVALRSLEARVLLLLGNARRAATLLAEALMPVANNHSLAIDDIRVELAKAYDALGERDRAIELLRKRARNGDASPELLRNLSRFVVARPNATLPVPYERASASRWAEAIKWLRSASSQEQDPERDLTRYNLALLLANSGSATEAEAIVDELLRSRRSHYHRAWYVLQIKGRATWHRAVERKEAGDAATAQEHFAAAAHFYGRAIWRRPKVRYIRPNRFRAPRVLRISVPPKMYGNAVDAHREAGRRVRAAVLFRLEVRGRRRVLRKGRKAMADRRFEDADAHFAWAIVGRRDDWDMHALLGRSLAHMGMAGQDRENGRETHAQEHEAPSLRYMEEAFAINPEHAREALQRMTGRDLSQV